MRNHRILNGYKVLYVPDHFNVMDSDNWKGYAYEHRYVIETELGRALNEDEVVHHLDCDRLNNSIDNLIILSCSHHRKLHVWLDKFIANGMTHPVLERRYCTECNTILQKDQLFTCSIKCSSSRRSKIVTNVSPRPNKDELISDIKNLSWVAIGKKYKVSDNAVRKWARKYGIIS
jgi:hypothetical protein